MTQNFDNIGVRLVALGLREYLAALKQAELAARAFNAAQDLNATGATRTRVSPQSIQQAAVARATAAKLNDIEDLKKFNAIQDAMLASGGKEAFRPVQEALREEKRAAEELLQIRQRQAQELKNRRADEALASKEASQASRDRTAEGRRFAEMESARRKDAELTRREISKTARDRQQEGARFAELRAAERADARRSGADEAARQKVRSERTRQELASERSFAQERREFNRNGPFVDSASGGNFNRDAAKFAKEQAAANGLLAREQKAAARESETLAKALKQQQAAFSGLNPHMAASIFYTQQVGAGFITLRGAAGLAALSISTIAQQAASFVTEAIKFEKVTAQLNSVLGVSPVLFRQIALDLRNLSKEIPFTVEQLTTIAVEAARAGVDGRNNILEFTKAIADFTAVSDISAKEAVTAFATISFALNEPPERIRALTSAVSELDKSLPTSQAKIVTFAERIAGAGQVVGLTSENVFAIAAAFSSVGIQAEAGGTAVQRVAFAINEAANEGGESLANFAKISNQTEEEFISQWESEPAKVFQNFVQGLGEAGDRASTVLKTLELGDVRLLRAFITTAQGPEKLAAAFEISDAASKKATATAERAAIIYATTASQITRLDNALTANAAEIGEVLLPTYRQFLQYVVENVLPALRALSDGFATEFAPAVGVAAASIREELSSAFSQMSGVEIPDQIKALTDLTGWVRTLNKSVIAVIGGVGFLGRELQIVGQSAIVAAHGLAVATVAAYALVSKDYSALREIPELLLQANVQTDRLKELFAESDEAGKKIAEAMRAVDRNTQAATASARELVNVQREGFNITKLIGLALPVEIESRKGIVRAYKEEQRAIEELDGARNERWSELQREISLQEKLIALGEEEQQQRENKFKTPPPLGDPNRFRDFGGDDDGKAKKWKQEFDALVKTLTDGLIPALRAAASILGDNFTGTVQRAALDTTGALTDALLRQAVIIGGPYGSALVAVAQSIASVTSATRELGDVQDAQFVTAESLLGQLSSAASLLQTLALANGDTAKAATQAQAAIDKLRTQFSRLTPEQQKVAGAILDAAEALVAQAAAAGANEDAQRVYKEGIDAAVTAAGDYVKAVDEMTAADKRRADASKTAAEKLAEAKSAESRANENLTKQNERLAAAQKALAEARKGGDPVAIKAASDAVALAKAAVARAKDRVRSRRDERKEADIDASEADAAKGEGPAAADARREELDEQEKKRKQDEKKLPPDQRRKLAALQQPEFISGTIPLRLSSIPGVSSIPLRPAAFAGGNVDSSRSVTVNASYVNQPEAEVKHDLQALSMMGLV